MLEVFTEGNCEGQELVVPFGEEPLCNDCVDLCRRFFQSPDGREANVAARSETQSCSQIWPATGT